MRILYLAIFLTCMSCQSNKVEELNMLKEENVILSNRLDSVYSYYSENKFGRGLSGLYLKNEVEKYDSLSEKFINYDTPEFFFHNFLSMALINENPKAYNDVCRVFVHHYGEDLKSNLKLVRVKYFSIYCLLKSYELGYNKCHEQFMFFNLDPNSLDKSTNYLIKSYD